MEPQDHQAYEWNDGFSCLLDTHAARRQLRMSVSIVVVLAAGIISAAMTFGSHPIEARKSVVSMPALTIMHAETNVLGAVRS